MQNKKHLLPISFSNEQEIPPLGTWRRVFYSAAKEENRSLLTRIREAFQDKSQVQKDALGLAITVFVVVVSFLVGYALFG